MRKVLILSAGFGEGHNAAARNLRDALEHLSDDVKVEILDLFETSYGKLNDLAKRAYLGLVRYTPGLWGGLYSLLDQSATVEKQLGTMGRLNDALSDILQQSQPDVVVSTYPAYAHAIREIYRDHRERPFRFITVVTDSITVNSAWFKAPSDWFCVPNDQTADVLLKAGVPESQVRVVGFPVSHLFAEEPPSPLPDPADAERRLLYVINTGKKKAGKVIEDLLGLKRTRVTVTVGRDAELKSKLAERLAPYGDRVEILGWTNQMPRLMQTHHLLIGKAGGATVQEAIAARIPMIVNQVIPGQEEGNAQLIERCDLGAIADKKGEIAELVEAAFKKDARQWHAWRKNLARVSRPAASLRLAEMILEEATPPETPRRTVPLFESSVANRVMQSAPSIGRPDAQMLLCDLHIHTNYSDGQLSVGDVIDFYGRRGFDCICITDHLADPRRLLGKLVRLTNLTLSPNQLEEYFEVLERERRRAWRKYSMHVMTGIEFNKDGLTGKSSAHLLGLDLQDIIRPDLDLPETIRQIHAQGGLAIASHPHVMKSEWGKNTLYLWENQASFAPLIDAWEIANRNNLFTPVGLKGLPFIANSDFHKPKHINSWKTLLHCEKDLAAIKDCLRRNKNVAITLYRDELADELPLRQRFEETFREHPAAALAAPVAAMNLVR